MVIVLSINVLPSIQTEEIWDFRKINLQDFIIIQPPLHYSGTAIPY